MATRNGNAPRGSAPSNLVAERFSHGMHSATALHDLSRSAQRMEAGASTRSLNIANLPNDIRKQLNLRLLEGESGRELVAWLNALPEVQSVLGSQFNGSPISEVNLTHWRQGGYLQWLTERECFDSARALAEADGGVATIGLSAERLFNVLTVRFGQLLMRWDSSPDEGISYHVAFSEVARKARILQGISRSLLAIHRRGERRGAGGGTEAAEQSQQSSPSRSIPKSDPLATTPIAMIAPASKPPVSPQHPVVPENRAAPHKNSASDATPKPAHPASQRPVASSNRVPGLAAAVSARIQALRGRAAARPEIPSDPMAPSIHPPTFPVSALRSPVSTKPELDLSESLHAV